jgi:hypothetical protein|tara:strand:+ start:616 stop:1035 length:420 start_codon:yes stop_codon:yes gene_type:complete
MARRITTISLDDESHEQAKHVGNLSAFVRQQLQEHAAQIKRQPVDYHNAMHQGVGKCHPHRALDGYCSICWPYGQPTKNEWHDWVRRYVNAPGSNKPEAPRQLPDRRHFTNSEKITQKESSETVSNNLGIIRKFWRWLF